MILWAAKSRTEIKTECKKKNPSRQKPRTRRQVTHKIITVSMCSCETCDETRYRPVMLLPCNAELTRLFRDRVGTRS